MNLFTRTIAALQLYHACRRADDLHAATGFRYYVIPQLTTSGTRRLVIVDRKNFRGLKRKHYIDEDARVADLVRESFYFTPGKSGAGALSPEARSLKRQQYFRWVEAVRRKSR